jgi:DEAD/DEAH box helicase domain-containing protein
VFYSLLLATSVNDDPVSLLKTAGRDHIPVNPSESSYREEMINVKVPTSNERLSIAEVVAELQTQTWVDDQIIYTKAFDAKEALTGKQMTHIYPLQLIYYLGVLEPALSQMVSRGLLESHNITSFYSHQVAAIRAVQRGMNVVVSTSTASGKSVIYQVLHFLGYGFKS